MNTGSAVQPGQFSAAAWATGMAVRVVHVSACPDSGPACAAGDVPPYLHDQGLTVLELRPVLELGITPNVGAELQLPVRLVSATITYRRLDGTPFEPPNATLHHRNETLAGLGDAWLSARAAWVTGPLRLGARLGSTLPLGSTVENPFALGAAGLEHQHVQFGSGTFQPLLGADATWGFGSAWSARGYAQWIPAPFQNRYGYRLGDKVNGGALVEWAPLPGLGVSAGADVLSEGAERWGGVVQQDGNVGRTDVLVGGGLQGHWPGVGKLFATVRVPVVQWFADADGHDGQLTYPAVLQVGFAR
jgi:hypothetical protein